MNAVVHSRHDAAPSQRPARQLMAFSISLASSSFLNFVLLSVTTERTSCSFAFQGLASVASAAGAPETVRGRVSQELCGFGGGTSRALASMRASVPTPRQRGCTWRRPRRISTNPCGRTQHAALGVGQPSDCTPIQPRSVSVERDCVSVEQLEVQAVKGFGCVL